MSDGKESEPVAFKQRKRAAPKHAAARTLPSKLDEVNGAPGVKKHRGLRDCIAIAGVLAEMELAQSEGRDVVLKRALCALSTDPFEWDALASNKLIVLWQAGDSRLQLATITIRYLMRAVAAIPDAAPA